MNVIEATNVHGNSYVYKELCTLATTYTPVLARVHNSYVYKELCTLASTGV